MKDSLKIALGIIIGVVGLAACAICAIALLTAAGITLFATAPTQPPLVLSMPSPAPGFPTTTESPPEAAATPTPSPLLEGEPLVVGDLEVAVLSDEVTDCVTLSSGDQSCPPDGAVYLWVQLHARHSGDASALPVWASFTTSLLYRDQPQPDAYVSDGTPDKPYWPGYTDGSGNTQMYGGGSLDGWLAFIVPSAFDVTDVLVHLHQWNDEHRFEADWVLRE